MLIDTHTHLYLENFLPDKKIAVDKALEAGIGKMIFPNVDLSTVEPMRELNAQYPSSTFMAMGLHPTEVKEDWKSSIDRIAEEFSLHPQDYIAVGEVGMDLYWDKTFCKEQMDVFDIQCRWALERDLPVIIHCRDAYDEALEVLSGLPAVPRAVFHSFGASEDVVDKIRKVGDFYFGLNGVVTYKNFSGRPTLEAIGIDRILLETDSPYLSPVPFRGKRNESSNLIHIARKVSSLLDIPLDEIEKVTTLNAKTLFALPDKE